MHRIARHIVMILVVLVDSGIAATPVVTNVVASQRADTKFVDIAYDVFDDDGDYLRVRVEISDDGGATYTVPAFSFTGDIGRDIMPGAGKAIVWDAGADWDGEYSEDMVVMVVVTDAQGLPGLEWGNEVPPGGFLMGQDGGSEGSGPAQHVNIPYSYWLSKYEIRNDEYCDFLNIALASDHVWRDGNLTVNAAANWLPGVSGTPVLINLGDDRDIRWNVNHFEVNGNRTNFPVRVTWYGAHAFAQYYRYDLPTEAEWEKAARGPFHDDGGEHLLFPWGNTIGRGNANYWDSNDPWDDNGNGAGFRNTSSVGYYSGLQSPSGPDMKSDYGLYDLVGNVAEWTRTRGDIEVTAYPQEDLLAGVNAYHAATALRIVRGGSFLSAWGADWTASTVSPTARRIHYRIGVRVDKDLGDGTNSARSDIGFRVIRRDQ